MSQLNKTVNLIQQYPIQFVANNGEIFIISYKSRDLVALMLIMAYDIPNLRDKFASLSKVDIYNEIILKLPEYFPTIFLNFCEEYLKTVRYDHESLVRKIREKQTEFNENIQNFINFIITKSRNKEMPDVPFFFSDDISRFCFKPSSNKLEPIFEYFWSPLPAAVAYFLIIPPAVVPPSFAAAAAAAALAAPAAPAK